MNKFLPVLAFLIFSACGLAIAQDKSPNSNYSIPQNLKVDDANADAHKALAANDTRLLTVSGFGSEIPGTDVKDQAALTAEYGTRMIDSAVSQYYKAVGMPLSEKENAQRYAGDYNQTILAFKNNFLTFENVNPHYFNVVSVPYSIRNNGIENLIFTCDVHKLMPKNWYRPSERWENIGWCADPGDAARNEKIDKPPELAHLLNKGEIQHLVWPYEIPGERKKKKALLPTGAYRFMAAVHVPARKDKWGMSERVFVFSNEFKIENTTEKPEPKQVNTLVLFKTKPRYSDVVSVPATIRNNDNTALIVTCDVHQKFLEGWERIDDCTDPKEKHAHMAFHLAVGKTKNLVWPDNISGKHKRIFSGTYRFMATVHPQGRKDEWGWDQMVFVFSDEFTIENTSETAEEKLQQDAKRKSRYPATTFGGLRETP